MLENLGQQIRAEGLLGTAIVFVLVTPDIVQGAQQGGDQGAVQAAGSAFQDIVVGLESSAAVGLGVTTGAVALGTSVTVGGTSVSGLAGTNRGWLRSNCHCYWRIQTRGSHRRIPRRRYVDP